MNEEIYHVFNRGIAAQPTFSDKRDYMRALETLFFYQNENPPVRYAKFLTLSRQQRSEILDKMAERKHLLVEIIAYCLMPNHFHLMLKQQADNGISKFMANFSNSYTRYFNTKYKRYGPLYQGKFKAIRVETDEQLFHLSRYIHLNPYSSYVVKTIEDLENYPFSSFPEYLGKAVNNYCAKEIILDNFKKSSYQKFVFDQADYQRGLEEIKHLTLEE